MRLTRPLILPVLCLALCYPLAANSVPTVTAQAASNPIVVDGRLDEAAWQQAGVIPDLTQQSPHPGAPTPFHTKILLLHDDHTLYIGIIADDPDPSRIATHTLVRDGELDNDDFVGFVIDSFATRRAAYVFQVNAAGAMNDGLLSSSTNDVDDNWDGIWKAAVQRNAHGWTAELAIDTRSLQFGKQASAWGFNVTRYVPRDLLTLNWSGTTLDSSVTDLQREGSLTGVQGLQQGRGWDFQPYGLARYQSGNGSTSNAGFDLKYNFNPSLAGLFTYHTDFAEAEADQQQINTGRFPLFFPEKRQFFLQGSNLFSFGYDLGTELIPFYSRKIGLVNGQSIPLNEGVKLIGQSDKGTLALLDTQMAGTSVSGATNLFAGRGTWNPDRNLQLGALVTRGDPLETSSNSFVGTDAVWKTSSFNGNKNLNLTAWAARSSGNVSTGNPNGYGATLEYPNDLWYFQAQYSQFGDALNPALGFLPRPGTRHYYTELTYQPRPLDTSLFSWVNQFYFNSHYTEDDGLGSGNGGKQSSEWWFAPGLTTDNGYHYQFGMFEDYDAPTQPFEVAPNVIIPAGRYRWDALFLSFNTPESYPLTVSVHYRSGPYYSGRLQYPSLEVNWNLPSGKLQLSASQDDLFGYLPQGNYYVRLSTLGGTWSFTPNLYISEFAQYTSDEPGVSMNTQLRWIVGEASNLYLVWNHGLVTETTGLGTPVVTRGNEVILKLQWDFRN